MKLAWKQVTLAFVIGTGMGAAATWAYAPRMFHPHWGSVQFQQHMLEQFSSKLRLTPDQRQHVAAILEAKREKMDALRAEIRPRFEALRTSTSAEIRQFLTPEQQTRFDVMESEWKTKRERFHERWRASESHG